jgi:NAD+ kinase
MDRIGVVVHGGRPAAAEAARTLIGWLREHALATRCLAGEGVEADEAVPADRFPDGLALVLSVGGDGTLLRAALLADRADAPLLGVNVGHLGFLTEAFPADAPSLIAAFLEGEAVIDERRPVVAEPEVAPWTEPQWALNEVIVEKRARHRLITLAARIDGEVVTRYSADGVIVATPTGSTAYSFSAGGPIVSPRVDCLLLSPVAPHMLFDRPILLAPGEALSLEVLGDEPGLLSADGRPGLQLPVGSRVRIRLAERAVRLVRRKDSPGFFDVLREKFALPAGEAPHGPVRPPD